MVNFALMVTLILGFIMVTGCNLITGTSKEKPIMATIPIIQNEEDEGSDKKQLKKTSLTMGELQAINMSFTDGFLLNISVAADALKRQMDTAQKRAAVQQWKLSHGNIMVIMASAPNPAISLVDLTVCTTLARMIFEDYWVPEVFGTNGNALLEIHRNQEEEIWSIANRVFSSEQSEHLKALIEDYHKENSGQRYGMVISISDYVKARRSSTRESKSRNANLLSLLRINPLTSLDPTTRAIQETRDFAQRSMYYFQRLPTVLRWQVEMMTLDIASSKTGQSIGESFLSFRENSDRFLKIAEELPDRLAQTQKSVLEDLSNQSLELEGLVKEINQGLSSGNSMATAVDRAIQSLDKFVARFDKEPGAPPSRGKPFDVLDYSTAAQSISVAARDLNTAITSLNQLMSSDKWKERQNEINMIIDEVESGGDQFLERAAFFMSILLTVFFLGLIISLLLYRYLALKWLPGPTSIKSGS